MYAAHIGRLSMNPFLPAASSAIMIAPSNAQKQINAILYFLFGFGGKIKCNTIAAAKKTAKSSAVDQCAYI